MAITIELLNKIVTDNITREDLNALEMEDSDRTRLYNYLKQTRSGEGMDEPPHDGKTYGRSNGKWVEVSKKGETVNINGDQVIGGKKEYVGEATFDDLLKVAFNKLINTTDGQSLIDYFDALAAKIGDLTTLTTNDKQNAVAAINELVTNIRDVYTKAEADAKFIDVYKIGSPNGVAGLGTDGKVPAAQLPSYVDDVLEFTSITAFPSTGESGKIYVATDTNLTYRWTGTTYTEIGQGIALGETASTAYAGNKGKQNADDIAEIKNQIGTHTVKTDVPENAVFTDTVVDVVDNLVSVNTDKALSARQGKELKDMIDNLTPGDQLFDKVDGAGSRVSILLRQPDAHKNESYVSPNEPGGMAIGYKNKIRNNGFVGGSNSYADKNGFAFGNCDEAVEGVAIGTYNRANNGFAVGQLAVAVGSRSAAIGMNTVILTITGAANATTYSYTISAFTGFKGNPEEFINAGCTIAGYDDNILYKIIAVDKVNKTITLDRTWGDGTSIYNKQVELSATFAEGKASFAHNGYAKGEKSVTLNESGLAKGKCSLAAGQGNVTENDNETAFGRFNKSTPNKTLFSVGRGGSDTNRKNVFEIDSAGGLFLLGAGGYDGTNVATATKVQDLLGGGSSDPNTSIPNSKIDDLFAPCVTVDLGLPSGIVWGKTNLGASREVDYGLFYKNGEPDGKTPAEASHFDGTYIGDSCDVVTFALGAGYSTPTKANIEELINNTNHTVETVDGVKGIKFANKTDSSKYIFIPFAGYCLNGAHNCSGQELNIWTSDSQTMEKPWALYADENGNVSASYARERWCGFSYRPIKLPQ